MFDLKLLTREGIPGALAKAERYRLLNQPWEAESIYRDVLETEPDHQDALIGLLLAVTDQFCDSVPGAVNHARELLPRLREEYDRAYYAGLICERRAKVLLQQARPGAGRMAYELLREAKACYEKAEAVRPPGNDDVLLRWNACARVMMHHPNVRPTSEERYEPYAD